MIYINKKYLKKGRVDMLVGVRILNLIKNDIA